VPTRSPYAVKEPPAIDSFALGTVFDIDGTWSVVLPPLRSSTSLGTPQFGRLDKVPDVGHTTVHSLLATTSVLVGWQSPLAVPVVPMSVRSVKTWSVVRCRVVVVGLVSSRMTRSPALTPARTPVPW